MSVTQTWKDNFAQILIDTLMKLHESIGNIPLSMIAIDCHPWHGGLYLAILQFSEVNCDPNLANLDEMAAWQMYDCAQSLSQWQPINKLAQKMGDDYSQATISKAIIAENYFQACADVLSSDKVSTIIQKFQLQDNFRISVAHPDHGKEFC